MARENFLLEVRQKDTTFTSVFLVKDDCLIRLCKKELYIFLSCQVPLFSMYASAPRYYSFNELVKFLISYAVNSSIPAYKLRIKHVF